MASLEGHTDSVFTLTALPDGSLVSGSTDKTLRIWKDAQCVSVLQGHAGTVSVLQWVLGCKCTVLVVSSWVYCDLVPFMRWKKGTIVNEGQF